MFSVDLKVVRGDTFVKTFQIVDKITGAPRDLSLWTWTAQVRTEPDATAIMATFIVDATQAAQGQLTLSIPNSVTATMGSGFWDLQGVRDGTTITRGGGRVSVKKDVTR